MLDADDVNAAAAQAWETRLCNAGQACNSNKGMIVKNDIYAARLAPGSKAGMANVNTPTGEGAAIPFGGTERRGFGRESGALRFDELANKRRL